MHTTENRHTVDLFLDVKDTSLSIFTNKLLDIHTANKTGSTCDLSECSYLK